ncbi:MAG: toprim domain-containing protein, partial [Clostridia bacterium]|nr:toprim domain-containing protein [Clostridia bacterium]
MVTPEIKCTKYLNSPESLVFNKRQNLYGLNFAKNRNDANKSLVLVEGYMDVVSLAANGINSGIASLGTSLTKEQARLIKRFVNEVYLCYDGDDPGINAALRAVDILQVTLRRKFRNEDYRCIDK